MSVPLLDLRAQWAAVRGEIEPAVAEVLDSQRFILGPHVEALEAAVREALGARHVVACASGTDALWLSLRALELAPGDEVIVPAFTFFATAGAVWNAGARPVFADIDARTFNMGGAEVEPHLTDRTRAIVAVHLFGQMAPMGPLLELAERHGLAIVEDAAQAIGARRRVGGEWREAGTLGDLGAFSFFPSKNLGAFGDGGLVTAMADALAERVRLLRGHGASRLYHHDIVGTNSRLDALQAAVLERKLPHLDAWAGARRRNAAWYDARFRALDAVTTPAADEDAHHVYNQYTLRARDRDGLKAHLEASGIGCAIYYPVPLHLQPCFAALGYRPGDLPVAEAAAGEAISLPVYPELTEAQLEEVASAIEAFYKD